MTHVHSDHLQPSQDDSEAPGHDTLAILDGLRRRLGEIIVEIDQMHRSLTNANSNGGISRDRAINIRMLGDFLVRCGKRDVDLRGRAARCITQVIAHHHPASVVRETIVEILWPDSDPESSRNRLNVAMHAVRRAFKDAGVADEVVVHSDGQYGFNTDLRVRVDAAEFARGVDGLLNGQPDLDADGLEQLSTIVAMYHGDYIANEPFEEWPQSERRYLRRLCVSALDVIGRMRLERGELLQCIDACTRIIHLDPAHEVAHRRMMVAFARDGRAAEALAQFEMCERELALHLDVAPSDTTLAAVRTIRRGQVP